MSEHIEELTKFIAEYSRAMESEIDRVGRENIFDYQESCKFLPTYIASDGIATFYMSGPPINGPPGIYVFDHSDYTLNQILQSLHLNRLQFQVPTKGSTFKPLGSQIEFTELIPELDTYYFSDAVRTAFLSGERSAPGMTVSPIINVVGGVVNDVRPSRVKLWSPVVEYPQIGRTNYFIWNHADIWWQSERLKLPDPIQTARLDLTAVLMLQRISGSLSLQEFGPDTNHNAADRLEKLLLEFLNLLDTEPREPVIHEWLWDHKHFLAPDACRILNKVPFGKYVSDFVIERADRTYELVEIEGVERIFTLSSSEPCARFNHACTQVRDWTRYINENTRTVASEQNLDGIYQPSGRVIMGRNRDITTDEAKQRWKQLKSESLVVETYDDVIGKARYLVETLRAMLNS